MACLSVALLSIIPVMGASGSFSATLSCAGFTPSGSFTADRDNTGSGQETLAINAVDGRGTVLFQLIDAVPLNWQVTPGAANWTTPPAANPITMSVISLDGNGLPQQTVYATSGACDGLPDGTPQDATNIAAAVAATGPANVQVSPPIPPGDDIPAPTTNTAAIELLPYYAITNTPRMNLRSGDGPQYLPVAVLRGGTRAQIVGRNNQTSWWLLEADGFVGWASDEFLAIRGDATKVPFIEAQGTVIPVTFVTSILHNVYSEPNNFTTNFVCQIPPSEYVVIGKDRFDVFYQIEATCTDGRSVTAWMKGEDGLFRNPAAIPIPVTG